MVDRQLRHTLSAAAWVGVFFCALGLLASATAVASLTHAQSAHAAPVEVSRP
jgi:hypothetical protein